MCLTKLILHKLMHLCTNFVLVISSTDQSLQHLNEWFSNLHENSLILKTKYLSPVYSSVYFWQQVSCSVWLND